MLRLRQTARWHCEALPYRNVRHLSPLHRHTVSYWCQPGRGHTPPPNLLTTSPSQEQPRLSKYLRPHRRAHHQLPRLQRHCPPSRQPRRGSSPDGHGHVSQPRQLWVCNPTHGQRLSGARRVRPTTCQQRVCLHDGNSTPTNCQSAFP